MAIEANNIEVIRVLVKAGANLVANYASGPGPEVPFELAIRSNKVAPATLEALLTGHKSLIDLPGNGSALFSAVLTQNMDKIRVLLEHGASDDRVSDTITGLPLALSRAIEFADGSALQLLLNQRFLYNKRKTTLEQALALARDIQPKNSNVIKILKAELKRLPSD